MLMTEKGMEKRITKGRNTLNSKAPYRMLSVQEIHYFVDEYMKLSNVNYITEGLLPSLADAFYFGVARGIEISKKP